MINFFTTQIKSQLNIKRLIALQVILLFFVGALHFSDIDLTKAFINQKKLTLGIINQDDNPLINVLIDSFKNNKAFTAQFNVLVNDEQVIINDFKSQVVDAYIVIPDGFTESVMGYDKQTLSLNTRSGFPTQRQLLKNIFVTYIDYVRLSNAATITLYEHLSDHGLSRDKLTEINRSFSITIIQTAMARQSLFSMKSLDEMANANSQTYYALMLSLTLISLLLISLTAQNLEFIMQKLGARITLTNISYQKYAFIMHAVQCLIALLGTVIAFAFLVFFMKTNALKLIIGFLFIAILWSNILFTIALVCNSPEQFTMIAVPLTIVTSTISGAFSPFTMLPKHLKILAKATPQFNIAGFILNFPMFSWLIPLLYVMCILILFAFQLILLPRKIKGDL